MPGGTGALRWWRALLGGPLGRWRTPAATHSDGPLRSAACSVAGRSGKEDFRRIRGENALRPALICRNVTERRNRDLLQNGGVTDPAEFIDSRLQYEGDAFRADAERLRLGSNLRFYGASVGAVRGTIRDALQKFRGLTRDDVTALATELWSVPVFERRLAAIVLLQTRVRALDNSDLTRLEGFVRSARHPALVDPLAIDVIAPIVAQLSGARRSRANAALDRWALEPDAWVRRAAGLVAVHNSSDSRQSGRVERSPQIEEELRPVSRQQGSSGARAAAKEETRRSDLE